MRKPNFFILGAPKCGTTSLAMWLEEHPNVFISPLKEPHFFNVDDRRATTSLDQYEKLFRGARPQHVAIGEASVWYLSSSQAVREILQYQPSARFIVMVRNPIEMAPALHSEMLLAGHENVSDFAKAWNLQEERRQGRSMPVFCWAQRRLLYGEACALGAQLERFLQAVPTNRVLVIVIDDVRQNPRKEYLRVLSFLGVADDGRSEFPIYNSARYPRWPRLVRLGYPIIQAKRRLGIETGLGLWGRLLLDNQLEGPRDPLPAELRAALRDHFRDDIQRLGRLLGRDLQAWLS